MEGFGAYLVSIGERAEAGCVRVAHSRSLVDQPLQKALVHAETLLASTEAVRSELSDGLNETEKQIEETWRLLDMVRRSAEIVEGLLDRAVQPIDRETGQPKNEKNLSAEVQFAQNDLDTLEAFLLEDDESLT